MNIIIVAKSLKCPKKLRLQDPRVIAALATVTVLVAGLGAAFALLWRDSSSLALHDIAKVRAEIAAQQRDVERIRSDMDIELNALAVRLGDLQAQSTRVNALGERLTRSAQLDDGEFDFSYTPAMGGPEAGDHFAADGHARIRASLDAFAERLSEQTRQLDVLEDLLLDREVETALLPAGMPVRAGYASSHFGTRSDPITGRQEFHRGIDFNGPRGADVLAVADGVVAFAGRHASYGNMVDIDHGNGYVTRYAHNDSNLVKPGQRVHSGDVIARMGATGRTTGVHVHFEVWHNDRPVNPTAYLKGAGRRG